MPQYKAPLRDMNFVMNDVLDYQKHYSKLPCAENATPDMVDAILGECAKFCEQVLSPLNQTGDQEGCQFEDGKVTTPKGFKEAYDQYCQGGWQGLSHPEEFGGQGMPLSLSVMKSEMIGTANWSWGMYPGLSLGAMNTIYLHGTEEQKHHFLPKMCEGTWSGTMCLTEPHCGTDLGQLKTKAVPKDDGSYAITGTKIFISSGDHDMAENIIHIVLARLPDAPAGTKGISLFIVPKVKCDPAGNLGDFNHVVCGSIEHKMGIRASATCVMNFEEAEGYLIGPPNKGLECMFTFMNSARVGTSLQGLGAAELSYQGALPYAKDRLSMRALSGKKHPDKVADPIICHADVRRMLLTQKAFAEGGRAMVYYAAKYADFMLFGETEAVRNEADDQLGFLTPILKAFLTETGYEAANLGMQVYGGHGYIKEWGMEQIVRDTRIATLYEGTTGIQALDLLGRKVLLGKMKTLKTFSLDVLKFCKDNGLISSNPHKKEMNRFIWPLFKYTTNWQQYSVRLAMRARKNFDVVGAASVDYLMYSGYVSMAYMWAMMAQAAYEKLAEGTDNPEFYKAKIQTADFYFERLLPRAKAHAECMMASPKSLMKMKEENFSFLD
ncbi:MAG: acyl-CoA dehydrogenase [Pseudomonadales bacterium]|jgi:alkylation response protein AidB-like acyl-CoA dehydrogenase|uniref:acyl-CoA dehydrogenase C-terminal domain-containing protein n=1 Tax=unclassified Ketobacter TaxID=2639109 RepID=UPI000C9241E5|nr:MULTISPECIES: acyl-CoA dehydrogenase C-terminal domain-containing protein [unclassified Ketobacter]MAQ23718.1 acyl-CoA dehydrogenase [Pseudomonadales bacterium]MEC8813805.1 acyl-CoA dehydrogenase C-terminal domain-containing protein [Pseudomonadota bacterium]TNC88765.1 MAG: acyl-CoA dehydrogenase [Alcanivorax sp.]HAG96192.1 acyl-CoA dehydrogenase [Gammaproteobacteria bacterium]MCK5792099.1 acyl-CoA dehydrogenase C-terminal domain-containing protein [Ketobacter sp.]